MTSRAAQLSQGPTLTCKYFDEPPLSFASAGQHIDPKIGIARFGPKSLNAPGRHPSKLRVGLIGTAATIEGAREWIEVNAQGVPGDDAHPAFPGCLPDRGFHTTLEFSDAWAEQITRSEIDDLLGVRSRKDRFNKALVLLDEKLAVLSRKDLTPEYIILALPDNLRDKCGVVDYFDQELGRVHRDLRRAFKANAMTYRLQRKVPRG